MFRNRFQNMYLAPRARSASEITLYVFSRTIFGLVDAWTRGRGRRSAPASAGLQTAAMTRGSGDVGICGCHRSPIRIGNAIASRSSSADVNHVRHQEWQRRPLSLPILASRDRYPECGANCRHRTQVRLPWVKPRRRTAISGALARQHHGECSAARRDDRSPGRCAQPLGA